MINATSDEQLKMTGAVWTKANERDMSLGTRGEQGGTETLRSEQERLAVSNEALTAVVRAMCSKWLHTSCGLIYLEERFAKESFQGVLERFGWEAWTPVIDCVIKACLTRSEDAIQGLYGAVLVLHPDVEMASERRKAAIASGKIASVAADICRKLSGRLVAQLLDENDFEERYPYSQYYVSRLLRALHCWGNDGQALITLVAHFMAQPQLYDVEKTLVPTIMELWAWLKERNETSPAWLVELCQDCLKVLERRYDEAPLGVRDWAARVECDCDCLHCTQLVDFCLNPVEIEVLASAKLSPEARAHVMDSIER